MSDSCSPHLITQQTQGRWWRGTPHASSDARMPTSASPAFLCKPPLPHHTSVGPDPAEQLVWVASVLFARVKTAVHLRMNPRRGADVRVTVKLISATQGQEVLVF